MGLLVRALVLAFPYLEAFAASIATYILLKGMMPMVMELLDAVRSSNLIVRLRALLDLRPIIANILSDSVTQQAAFSQGVDILNIQQQVDTSLARAYDSNLPMLTFPTLSTEDALTAYIAPWQNLHNLGLINETTWQTIVTHWRVQGAAMFAREQAAAQAAAIPAVVPQAVTTVTPQAVTTVTPQATTQALTIVTPAPVVNVYPQPVSVAAPNVNVYPPQVTVNTPAITNNINIGAIVAALGALAGTLTASLASSAGDIAHNATAGRVKCQTTTGLGIFENLLKATAPVAITLALDKFGPFRGKLNEVFTGLFDQVLDDPALQRPVTPEGAPALASALFLKALAAGQSAHLISVVAESFSPLKYLGLSQMAAFLGDMAGFGKIGGAMMGVIETQALAKPFGYYINNRTRPLLPSIGELRALGAEYALLAHDQAQQYLQPGGDLAQLDALNKQEFTRWGAYSGYSDDWLGKMTSTLHRPATRFVMRDVVDSGLWDEGYFRQELASAGYNVPTINQSLRALKRFSVKGEIDLLTSESTFDFLDGFIDEAQLRVDLEDLGLMPSRIEARVQGAISRRRRDWEKKRILYLTTAAVNRRITETDLAEELTAMGVVEERRFNLLEEVNLRRRVETPIPAVTTAERSLAGELEQQAIAELISPEELTSQLRLLGFSETETETTVRTVEFKLARKQAGKAVPGEEPPVTAAERALATELEQHVINEMLTLEDYAARLKAIGFADVDIDVRVDTAGLKLARKRAGKLAKEEATVLVT